MNPDMGSQAQEMIYGEIGDFADGMMVQGPDYFQNRVKPENIPGDNPAEPGVTFSDDEMGMLEQQYGCATDPTNY